MVEEKPPEQRSLGVGEPIGPDPYIIYGPIDLDSFSTYIRYGYYPYSYLVKSRDGQPIKKTVFIREYQKRVVDAFLSHGKITRTAEAMGMPSDRVRRALRVPAVWSLYIDLLGHKCELNLDLSNRFSELLIRACDDKHMTKNDILNLIDMIYEQLHGRPRNWRLVKKAKFQNITVAEAK